MFTSLSVVATLSVMAVMAPATVAAQDEAPRTAWGKPDLQGVWDFRTITPMQRPERYGDKAFLTAEEAAQLDRAEAERQRVLWEAPPERTEVGANVDRRSEVGETRGAPGSYNQFWIDVGTNTVETRRTSLIT
ncbi:MAG: hypothetical protein VYE68_08895, partial [Acidobacteriota bacterium]|nr:hypothetical protein [Acidobacteriota bacterium]